MEAPCTVCARSSIEGGKSGFPFDHKYITFQYDGHASALTNNNIIVRIPFFNVMMGASSYDHVMGGNNKYVPKLSVDPPVSPVAVGRTDEQEVPLIGMPYVKGRSRR